MHILVTNIVLKSIVQSPVEAADTLGVAQAAAVRAEQQRAGVHGHFFF